MIQHHGRACGVEGAGHLRANALGGTRDEGDFAGEIDCEAHESEVEPILESSTMRFCLRCDDGADEMVVRGHRLKAYATTLNVRDRFEDHLAVYPPSTGRFTPVT